MKIFFCCIVILLLNVSGCSDSEFPKVTNTKAKEYEALIVELVKQVGGGLKNSCYQSLKHGVLVVCEVYPFDVEEASNFLYQMGWKMQQNPLEKITVFVTHKENLTIEIADRNLFFVSVKSR